MMSADEEAGIHAACPTTLCYDAGIVLIFFLLLLLL